MTKQSLGGPFKPSFGLSGVVADQAIRSVSLGAKPRNLQVPPPVSNAYGETVLFIGSSLTRRDELWPEMNVKTNADSIGFIFVPRERSRGICSSVNQQSTPREAAPPHPLPRQSPLHHLADQ